MNLDLPRKIRSLGALPIPMDMLPLDEKPLSKRWRKVYWRYGQKIMKAADYVRNHPHLFAVYITNFSCGPDSFILEFFRKEMSPKPYLTLEIDEHSADAGLITRCEAFLDTLENVRRRGVRPAPVEAPALVQTYTNHRRIYVPNMAPHAHGLSAAFRSVGVESEVMPLPDLESVHLGERYTSGRECYPCLLTTGDMVRQTRRPDFDPSKSAFFMAAADGPCRFGQYNRLQREVLDQLGLNEVPIFTLEQGDEYRKVMSSLGARFERRAWLGIAAVDIMERLLLEKRPVEKSPGATEAWFDKSLKRVCDTMANDTKNFFEALRQAAEDYRGVEANDEPDRPLVGVVGEVYVRANTFANQDLIRQIEALGGRAVVPTMGEWIRYTRLLRADWNRVWGHYGRLIMDGISNHVLEADERRVYRAFGRVADPSPRGLFELAEPYLDKSFEGETILTVGKSIELIRHEGARGIVNTMPFTCMPGAICSALLKRVREDHDDIPMLSMSYTVQQSGNNQSRLEAFMYQVREYRPAAGAARASHA
jgi:predicted nucleotide-binding protein (sugar kinase/HSP70/actin superfamily)